MPTRARVLSSGFGAAVLCCAPALAQSINVAIGPAGSTPPGSQYGGAGRPGVWNVIEALHASSQFGIVDIDGNPTGLRIRQVGGTAPLSSDDPATAGDDELLMDHCMRTFTANLETCIYVDFLEPGEYEAIVYAWMPNAPDIRAYVSCDEEPGFPHHIVGGAWPGGHAEFVTYSRHSAIVGLNGQLRLHSGIVPGHPAALGAAMNGFQLRRLPAFLAGDMNCDGVVSVADIGGFVLALTDPGAYAGTYPDCDAAHADLSGDGTVGVSDIGPFVALLTGP
jgi:hypothetical protein